MKAHDNRIRAATQSDLRGPVAASSLLGVFVLAAVLWASLCAAAQDLPPEVARYLEERRLCDHFRGEPTEGNSPGQVERRAFVHDSLEIHCSGTDRRLAALKRRYATNRPVMDALRALEEKVE